MAKPVLLVTRRLPPAVEARAAADFDARLTPSDVPIDDIVRAGRRRRRDPDLSGRQLRRRPDRGTAREREGHRDVQRRLRPHRRCQRGGARHRVCNTPDVLSVATAETALLLILAAARRAGEGERLIRSGTLAGLGADAVARRRRGRSAAGHLRHGSHRPRAGAHGARHRHDDPLSRRDAAAACAGGRCDLPRHRRRTSWRPATC